MKDDEVVAHYVHAGDGSPGVIRIRQLAELVLALPMTMHRTRRRPDTDGAPTRVLKGRLARVKAGTVEDLTDQRPLRVGVVIHV
jgi:hypothetical protein